jgi:hypothetical protein
MIMRNLLSPLLAIAVMVTAGTAATVEATEWSAARTTKKKVRVVAPHPYPAYQPVAVYRWRPADPSFDQYGRLYQPPPGLYCPIDLGYGRWGSCSNR